MDVEAEKQKNDEVRGLNRVNKLKVLNATQKFDEVVKLAPGYLAFSEKRQLWDVYFQHFEPWIVSLRNQGKENEALALAQKMYDFAKEINNDTGMGMALFCMAPIYGSQYRFAEQEQCYRDAITLLQNNNSTLGVLSNCYTRLGNCLVAQRRYDEAVQIADETADVIRRYEEATGSPQPNAWTNQLMVYRTAYYMSEQYDLAEIYCIKVDSITNGRVKSYEERSAIYASRGQFKEALEMADKAIESVGPKSKPQAIGAKMMVLLKKEGTEALEQTFRDAVGALISKHRDEFSTQLDEIRTQYEVDKHIAEKIRNRNYFLFALGGCVLLVIALGIWIYYSRKIIRKNRGLYLQIKEQDRLAEELEAMTKQYEQMSQLVPPVAEEQVATDESIKLPGNKQQRQLVSRLREFLLKDRYFAIFDIDIQKLIPEMATNRTYLFEALKAVTGKTPMEFITHLRLDEAKRLLDNSVLTIESIATECGFNTTSTFYRQFRDRYRITPSEYRKIAKE
jgi:AraC-like DNA-binding protein